MKQTFDYDKILYNELILNQEQKWNRKLTDHEKHVLIEGYKFGRLIEAHSYYSQDVIDWQLSLRKG